MGHYRLDNGDAFMRAQREAQQNLTQYNNPLSSAAQQARNQYLSGMLNAYASYGAHAGPTPGERPEPEDTTGLKMLEEFLAKRKGERDGDERK